LWVAAIGHPIDNPNCLEPVEIPFEKLESKLQTAGLVELRPLNDLLKLVQRLSTRPYRKLRLDDRPVRNRTWPTGAKQTDGKSAKRKRGGH